MFYKSKLLKLFPKNIIGVMLFGFIFFREDKTKIKFNHINHELIHKTQYNDFLGIGFAIMIAIIFGNFIFENHGLWMISLLSIPLFSFYVWYGIEYMIRRIQYTNHKDAYYNISLEREAYDNEHIVCDIKGRPSFNFLKYLKKS